VERSLSRYRLAGIAAVVAVGGWLAATACSNYSEGERCETANNNEDCNTEQGLICTRVEELAPGYNNAQTQGDRCCPSDRNLASHPACKFPQEDSGVFGPPPDAAADADATVEDVDAGTDADVDADAGDAGDAIADADADGG
jgi:hypothetical protein